MLGAFLIEFIRYRSRTAGDVALALLFYGGIAGGVMFASLAPGKASSSLNAYLFGSLSTVAEGDIWALGALCLGVVVVIAVLGRELFAVSLDPDIAAVQGIRVRVMSTLMAVLAAVVVVVGMRVVGPAARQRHHDRPGRRRAAGHAVLPCHGRASPSSLGLVASLTGLVGSFYVEVPPGPTIVLVALLCFAVLAVVAVPIRRRRREAT